MLYHPEARENEVFVGNRSVRCGVRIPTYLSHLKTARLGEQAYDVYGRPLPRHLWRPLLIDRSEEGEHDQIMISLWRAAK